MSNKQNNYYAIAYKLYTIKDGERTYIEEAPENDPFVFISGFGTTIPGFESNIGTLTEGQDFDFTIARAEAYGDYVAERVLDLDKAIFTIDGKFDDERIFPEAIVPLQNEDGNRFNARVVSISDDKVKVDLNHPLAGMDLNFVGKVITCREATIQEITNMLNQLGGGCGGCGGGGCHGGSCDNNCEKGCEGGGCGNCQ